MKIFCDLTISRNNFKSIEVARALVGAKGTSPITLVDYTGDESKDIEQNVYSMNLWGRD